MSTPVRWCIVSSRKCWRCWIRCVRDKTMLTQDHALTAQDFLTASGRAFDENYPVPRRLRLRAGHRLGRKATCRSVTARWLPAAVTSGAATSGAVEMIESIAGQARGRLTIHGVVCPAHGRRQFVDRRQYGSAVSGDEFALRHAVVAFDPLDSLHSPCRGIVASPTRSYG